MVLPPRGWATIEQLVFLPVGEAAGVPILIQDSSQVTGVELTQDAFVRLRDAHPLLGAAKVEAPGAGPKVSRLVEAGVEVIAGWGGLHYVESLAPGTAGCMPGCDLASAIAQIDRQWRTGSKAEAEALYLKILPLLAYAARSLSLLVLRAKRALQRAGICPAGMMRAPAPEADRHQVKTLDALFDRLHAEAIPGW